MPIVSNEFIEQTASRMAELQAEVDSYADELAEMTVRAEVAEAKLREFVSRNPDAL